MSRVAEHDGEEERESDDGEDGCGGGKKNGQADGNNARTRQMRNLQNRLVKADSRTGIDLSVSRDAVGGDEAVEGGGVFVQTEVRRRLFLQPTPKRRVGGDECKIPAFKFLIFSATGMGVREEPHADLGIYNAEEGGNECARGGGGAAQGQLDGLYVPLRAPPLSDQTLATYQEASESSLSLP